MKSPVVRLKLRARLPDGSRRYLEPVYTGNHHLKPGYALLHGQPQHFPEAVYNLRYLKGGGRIWEPVGTDWQFALLQKTKREKMLEAEQLGIVVLDEAHKESRTRLDVAIAEYLAEVEAHKTVKTFQAYSRALVLFQESCKRKFLDEVVRKDILEYMTFLRNDDNEPRTVFNRVASVKRFMRHVNFEWPLKAGRAEVYGEGGNRLPIRRTPADARRCNQRRSSDDSVLSIHRSS